MKTRSKAALSFLLLLLCVAFAPWFLRMDQAQTAIIGLLQRELPFEMRLESIRWHWWPLPRLTFQDLHLKSEHWQLTAPAAEFYPSWMAIIRQTGGAGRIVLKQPTGRFEKAAAEGLARKSHAGNLPHLVLAVENGSFSIPAGAFPFRVATERLHLTAITGRIDLDPEKIVVQASAASPLFQKISIKGGFYPPTASYRFQFESRRFAIHKAITSLGGHLITGESIVDFRGEIEGSGLKNFRADLTGELPCFLVRPQETSLPITCGLADLRLVKSGDLVELVINKMDLQEPHLTLQGKLRRSRPDPAQEPQWEIDLTARNLDLDDIREKTLTVLGNNHLVREITDIVRGGTASAIRFGFAGPAADFRRLEAMTIEGQLDKVKLLVPEVKLDLYDLSGEFAIRDGRLTGWNLQTKLGTSAGWNGELLLALTGDERAFRLDLDLEAELAELPGVLHQTVPSDAFLREVDRFSDIKGRVNGHLRLGDRVRNPVVEVLVDELKVSGRYGRLSWPFRIEGGRLEVVSDRRVSWEDLKATIGPHLIAGSTGLVSWQEGLRLDLDSFQASLAGGPLYQELNSHPDLHRHISAAVSALAGKFEVTEGTFHGPLHRQDQWQYAFKIEGSDLEWTSPLLGPSVSTRKLSGSLSHHEAVVIASENRLQGQRLSVQGRFRHQQLAQWHGWVEIDGAAERRLAAWVKDKGWVPATFFPRIPCIMEGLRIGWGPEHLSVSGGIIAGKNRQDLPRVDFELQKTGTHLAFKRVAIAAADEHGLMTLDLPAGGSAGFELNWRGNIDGRTIDALLESNRLLDGRLAGICTFRYTPGQPQQTRLVGTLQATDLKLPLPDPEPLLIKRLQLNGNGASLDIALLQMQFADERSQAQGRIVTTPEGLDLDLILSSPLLSWSSLQRLQKSFAAEKGGGASWGRWDLGGRIDFDIAEFRTAHVSDFGGESTTGYQWRPLQGVIELQPGAPWQITVDNARVCGLAMNGTWSSEEDALIRLLGDPQAPPAFEEVMPCLGIEQDLLVGEFSLDATLQGLPGRWIGGRARLSSVNGNIRRLTLLSRIFSVVNFVDLFKDERGPGPIAGGLSYSKMDLEARVADNHLVIEKAAVRGEGLNLFGRGELNLSTFRSDLTILIAPFKTIDAIVTRVPVIGRVIGGKNATLVTIPVGVKGPIADPSVMVLAPEAVGESVLVLVRDTLSLPFTILSPIFVEADNVKTENSSDSSQPQ